MLSLNYWYLFSSLRIAIKSSSLIFLSINALDILLSMLFNLLLPSVTILLCFSFYFLLFLIFFFFFINSDDIEHIRPKIVPIIPAGAPITVANDTIKMLPDKIDKTFNALSK